MNKRFLLYFLTLIIFKNVIAQLSTTHYLPPIYCKVDPKGAIGALELFISTPSDSSFYVKIYSGTNPNAIDSIPISSSTSAKYSLGKALNAKNLITEAGQLNTPLDNGGLTLKAVSPFFANIRGHSVNQGFSLTSKGKAALGTSFRTGHMLQGSHYTKDNKGLFSNFISVMATKNNTKLRFSDFKKGVEFYGLDYTGKIKTMRTSVPLDVVLDEGQSFVIAQHGEDFDFKDENKSFGSLVTSNKPIAVSIGSILATSPAGGAADVGLDQIVPVTGVGTEYILMRGQGGNTLERPVIVATEDRTTLKINGTEHPRTLSAGESLILNGSSFSKAHNLHLESSAPIYVYQTTAGSSSAATCGLNFVPPLNECASANSTFIPNTHFASGHVYLNIAAKTFAPINIIDAKINKKLITLESEKSNIANPLKRKWVTYKYLIPKSVTDIGVISDEAINVSMTVESHVIGAAGYFSGFTPNPIIVAVGGKSAFYQNKELKLKLKQYKSFDHFKWYYNGKFLTETKKPELMIHKTGEYSVAGIDRSCSHKEFMSSPFYLDELKKIELEEVEDLFSEETDEELEIAIKNNDSKPILVNLNYVYDKAELVEESIPLLDNIVSILKKHKDIKIRILAHTDCKGSDSYNLKLSQLRADYVKNYIISQGIAGERLEAKGMGESSPLPLAACDCEKNQCSETQLALNRRSEFVIISE